MKIFRSNSVEETQEFAKNLAESLSPNCIITLIGDLGAGKTAFTKGFAKGLGIKSNITSPTFALLNTYNAPNNIVFNHFDLYRLEDIEEFYMMGFFENIMEDNAINVIEWPQIIEDILPNNVISIHINKIGDNEREIVVE